MSFEKRQFYFQAQLESEQAGQDKQLSFTISVSYTADWTIFTVN